MPHESKNGSSDPMVRFWAKVDKSGDCWLWTASCFPDGYGQFLVDGRPVRVHRWIYQQLVKPVPKGLCVMHSCDVRACVKLEHLSVGTPADNSADMVAKGRASTHTRKLNHETADEIRVIYSRGGITQRELAKLFGVSDTLINHVVNFNAWT